MKHKLLSFILLLFALVAGIGSVWADTYNLVKNVSELSEGDVILIASGTTGSVKALGAQNSNNRAAASVTVTDGVISSIGNAVELTLDAKNASGKYTLKSSTGYLYAANSSNGKNNYLKEKDSKVYWSIEVNTSTYVATIKDSESSCNGKNWLRYNSGSTLFSCYSSGQNNVYIYKKQAEVAVTSLLVKTAPTKVHYEVGEALDMTGFVLDADGADVTSGYTMKIGETAISNGATLSSVGKKTITVTYRGKTVDQVISVGSATSIAVTTAPTKTSYDTGDSFDPTGMVVTATLSTGEALDPDTWTKEVTGYTIDPADGLQPSNTYVTITYAEQTATQNITVTDVAVKGVALNKTSTTIATGGTETLTLTFTPANATNKAVTWSSSDETVATVVDGKVTAVKSGTATITVTTTEGGFKAICTVTVIAAKGSVENPYTVAEVIDGKATGSGKYVKGYIVGSYGSGSKSNFARSGVSNANLALADDPDENDKDNTAPLQLPKGSVVRDNFNVQDNPQHIGVTQVIICGSIESYMSSNGIKSPSSATKVAEAVKVSNVGYATWSSDSPLDFTGSEVKAYVGTVSGGNLTFTPVTEVPANTGLLLYKEGGATVNVPVIASAAAVGENCLTGVNEATSISSDDYILNKVGENVGFYKAGSFTSLAAHRAYITSTAAAGIKNFVLNFDETDGIVEIMRNGDNEKMSAIFDLSGRRVSKPTKGIYVKNGRKFIVK